MFGGISVPCLTISVFFTLMVKEKSLLLCDLLSWVMIAALSANRSSHRRTSTVFVFAQSLARLNREPSILV